MTTESRQLGGAAACRFCGELLSDNVVDLGMSPLCESSERDRAYPDFVPERAAARSAS
jgi:hypothetical protein